MLVVVGMCGVAGVVVVVVVVGGVVVVAAAAAVAAVAAAIAAAARTVAVAPVVVRCKWPLGTRENSYSGSLKSYQLYLTVCNRQLGKLVRVGNSTQGPARALERVPDRDSEPRLRRGRLGIRVGIRWGSKGDPVRFQGIRPSGSVKNTLGSGGSCPTTSPLYNIN